MTLWQVTRLNGSLGKHAAAWDALNQRLFNRHPMLDSSFVDGLLKHFGNGSEHLCALIPHGEPEAMCLLVPRGFGVWGTFLPSQAQMGPILISKLHALTGLINSLPGFVIRLDFLCIDPQFSDLSIGERDTSVRMDHALTMNVNLKSGFKTYWDTRSKNLTKNIRRYERRLSEDNIARRFLCITDPKDIGDAVARYAELESKGWKSNNDTALGTANIQGLFYTELLGRLSTSGNAMVCELWFDTQLAASRLMIVSDSMAIILKTTYEEAFKQYAPGRLLLRDVIQTMCEDHPDKTLEFYTDANPDQLAWATGQRWITHWSFYKNQFFADLFGAVSSVLKSSRSSASSELPLDNTYSVEVFQHLNQLPTDVQKLLEDAEHDNFQGGVPWYKTLVEAVYPKEVGAHIYVLRRSGHPVAALPIVASKGLFGWHIRALGNYYTSLYAPAIASGLKYRDFALLLKAVMETHSPVASMRFEPMDPESSPYHILWNALQASGLAPFGYFCFGNWYLTDITTWQNYLQGRDGQLRNTIRRTTKKFTAAGGSLELIQSSTEIARGQAAFEQVYAQSWKRPEPYPMFVPSLIRTCAERGWLRLGVAWLNGTPIAAQLWIVANGKANIYKLAYDENYKPHGTGTLLTTMLMEHVIEKDGVYEVDYLTGDDPYKKGWMSNRRERWGIIAFNAKTVSGLLGLSKELLGRVMRSVLVNFAPAGNHAK